MATKEDKMDFHHPYTPYNIQETFMSTVYQTLEDSKVGILESPTGTGKSLSLICGSLTWLRDHKRREFENGLKWDQESDDPEWVIEQTKARKRREMLCQREDMEARLAKVRAKEKARKEKYLKGDQSFKRRRVDANLEENNDEEQFVLGEYESDDENGIAKPRMEGLYSAETLALMKKLGMGKSIKEDEVEEEDETKIFYCSRTHSQLSQFINELRRPNFPPAISDDSAKADKREDLRHVTLGSRKNLCINPAVSKLNSLSAINERCAELQKSGIPQDHKCPFIPTKDNQPLVNEFRDHTLASLRDIEDMGELGKKIGICPYYASRAAIKSAEIVTLPYPLLLQKSAREALGLNLKGHVVIIDEAHNLMDAIAGIHSVEVSLKQLKEARAQIGVYLQRFRNRLKGKNRVYVAQVVRVIDSLSVYLESRLSIQGKWDGIASKDILSGKGVDQINLYKLVKYIQGSRMARKIEGYAVHSSSIPDKLSLSSQSKPNNAGSATPVLHHVTSLLTALTHPSAEGQFFFSKSPDPKTPDSITLKFQLLDPSTHFSEITSSARSVILAGGTMSPMSDYTSHLFPLLPPTSLTTLSCGHVIPKSNLLAWTLSTGPNSVPFDFTFKNRSNTAMIDELGRALLNICTIVPDGVVVFFPSYNALADITKRWEFSPPPSPTQAVKSIYSRLESKKALFRESKEESVDTTLTAYAQAIDSGKGGLLLSVVGGKMSEGINFSDSLGRCVVIVGLPFPNIASAEWKAKLEYIESSTLSRLETDPSVNGTLSQAEKVAKSKEQAREFYENACMRAVNQSVGRAIRHKSDYASVIMIDKRFSSERIRGKLPGWIREGLVEGAAEKSFGMLMGELGGFYRAKKDGA